MSKFRIHVAGLIKFYVYGSGGVSFTALFFIWTICLQAYVSFRRTTIFLVSISITGVEIQNQDGFCSLPCLLPNLAALVEVMFIRLAA